MERGRKMQQEAAKDKALVELHEISKPEEGPYKDAVPFVKSKALWSIVESLEPFKKWPQKPHFQPLQKLDESCREGKAIELMVNFCNIVELSSEVEFLNEVKRMGNALLKTLVEFEENGFDVKVIRDRMEISAADEEDAGRDVANVFHLLEEFEKA